MSDDHDGWAVRIAERAEEARTAVAVAESLTGGMISSALAAAPGASGWYRGGIVAYSSDVKYDLLGVAPGPVVSSAAAEAMALGVRRLLRADLAVAVTGAGGPDPQDGEPPGTVFLAVADADGVRTQRLHVEGDGPATICSRTATEALRALLDHLGRESAGDAERAGRR